MSTTFRQSRTTRLLLALGAALAMLLAGAPLTVAQESPEPEWQGTDPSAEEALGSLEGLDAAPADDGLAGLSSADVAVEDEPDEIVVENGVTQPVFSYENAIRESIRIPGVASTEDSGVIDMINVDIIRPAASDGDLRVPTIIIPSPYYQSSGRGRASEGKANIVRDVTVGDTTVSGGTLTPALPQIAVSGTLVNCGLAAAPADCGDAAPGFVALIERGGPTFVQKAENAQAAGAAGAIIYNNVAGTFSTTITSVSIPVNALTQADGQALLPLVGQTATLTDNDGLDQYPLYYDNVFVPRGYAVAALDLAGTRASTGCLDIGGPGEIDNTGQFIKWLTGDAVGYDVHGNEIEATWSNGKSGITGKSWDGTVANGVAALGLDGLTTIVPIEGISSWYLWYWHNGARFTGHSPLSLANSIGNTPAARCSQVRTELDVENVADETTDFWQTRNYIKDVDKFKASVFVVHGLNDYNVKPSNYGELWEALEEHDVPRKIWLSQVAHEKGFDFRRTEWLETIHRWWDHWLHDIDNGIMDEPMADVEYAPDAWATFDTWPGGEPTRLHLNHPDGGNDPRVGALTIDERNTDGSMTFTELRRSHDNAAQNGFTQLGDRLIFMTEELSEDVRVSGTTTISLSATITNNTNTHLGAYLVDYGTAPRTNWTTGGGILDLTSVSCFGEGTAADTGCYRDVERRIRTRPYEVVARGWMNGRYITGETTLEPGETYQLEWDIMATDYTFFAGHRIGIVVTGVDSGSVANLGTNGTQLQVHLGDSYVDLPIQDAEASIGFAVLTAELDRLVAAGGITPALESRIRHALAMYADWIQNPRQRGPALSHLDRAVRLLEWQADVVDRTGLPQGDPAGLRRLASSIRALYDAQRNL